MDTLKVLFALIIVFIILLLINSYMSRQYVDVNFRLKGQDYVMGIPVNYDAACKGSVTDLSTRNNPLVNVQYACDIDMSPVDEELNYLNGVVNKNAAIKYSDSVKNVKRTGDDTIVNFKHMGDEEILTTGKVAPTKKVKNVVPGSKQDRMNQLSKELPASASSAEMQTPGRGTDMSLPETMQVTN